METVETDRIILVSKDETVDMHELANGVELLLEDKLHIDSEKTSFLEVIATQIHHHREASGGSPQSEHEVSHWARLLYHLCFVENRRNRHKAAQIKSLETELYNTLARLFPE